MNDRPYESLELEELILRDRLAADRTSLANERTLLAYVRTSLTLLVAGLAFINVTVFHSPFNRIVGWCFVPVAVILLVIGIVRYRSVRRGVKELRALTGTMDRVVHGGEPGSPE